MYSRWIFCCLVAGLIAVSPGATSFKTLAAPQAKTQTTVTGTVKDRTGKSFPDARITLLNSQQAIIATARTDAEGKFVFSAVPQGTFEVNVEGLGNLQARQAIQVTDGSPVECELILDFSPFTDVVTVTADVGQVQDKDQLGQQVNVIPATTIQERATEVIAQVAAGEVGAALQRTSPTIGGIYVRGLTGKNVVVFIDGVRYSNSAQRGGINTFLNLIEPSNLRSVELLRGPNSSQYGSDSLGGSIQFVSSPATFSTTGFDFHGQTSLFANSASATFGQATRFGFGGNNFGFLVNLAARRTNTLRPGNGIDTHAAVTRFLGLPSNIINGNRLPDTGFTEYGGNIRFNYAFGGGNQFIFNYQRSQQDGGKRYDQLLGGDGNNIAELENLMLDFGYVRFDTQRLAIADNFAVSFSFNSQREERINQGGNGNPLGSITYQPERTRTYGLQFFGNKRVGNHNLLLGGDYYHDRLISPAFTVSVVSNSQNFSRPRVPNNAFYHNYGFYAQDVWKAIPERLNISASVRYGAASYKSRAIDSPIVRGERLWPDDSLRVDQVTFRTSGVLKLIGGLSLGANFSRGFRAPHMTDLGTLGLTGDGFEIAAPDVVGLGGEVGNSASSRAVTTGRPVTQVGSEVSKNYELSLRFRNDWLDTDFGGFITDIDDNIQKQALILPQGAVGKSLGGEVITSQLPSGVVFVDASTNPVLVRSNFDNIRLWGLEYSLDAKLNAAWSLGGNFTYIYARDKATGVPPNLEGGTPAPNGTLRLRYNPSGKRYWVEVSGFAAYRQDRLSSLDLSDRRTGANRSRTSIRNFFYNGATVRGLVAPGTDGRFGTADDVLRQTGETLEQVQNRVLGNLEQSPMFPYVPGYGLLNVRGGIRLTDNQELFLALENITDASHRGINWGIDGPGINFTARYTIKF
ncbi:MAG: TonB-dependent receptor [Acidobacteria bacterium]|nr:TonB-dependent receptor [Acidobacteriota bacterium]